MTEILTFGRYLRQKYHKKIFKVPISLSGFTCPNIDGTVAKGGCVYCDNSSFSPNLHVKSGPLSKNSIVNRQSKQLDIQFEQTSKNFIQEMGENIGFIVYFQSFSNSYAPLENLKTLYTHALQKKDVVGISIGTRADCVEYELLEFLDTLANTNEIWIEIGVQSVFDKTLEIINRGETYELIRQMLQRIKQTKIKLCVHLIYGLPNETRSDFLHSFQSVMDLGVDSVKIHPLYVVKNTALAKQHFKGELNLIEKQDYIEAVVQSMKKLPQNVSVQRVTAGIDDESLIAPSWCESKNVLLNDIRKALKAHNLLY